MLEEKPKKKAKSKSKRKSLGEFLEGCSLLWHGASHQKVALFYGQLPSDKALG
jgi:hypothetical protein